MVSRHSCVLWFQLGCNAQANTDWSKCWWSCGCVADSSRQVTSPAILTWGCGQLSFAAISSSAPSMTAAPLSMVAMRMSCPGQSTNDTCLISCMGPLHRSQGGLSSCVGTTSVTNEQKAGQGTRCQTHVMCEKREGPCDVQSSSQHVWLHTLQTRVDCSVVWITTAVLQKA
jgi:hypothetical protein